LKKERRSVEDQSQRGEKAAGHRFMGLAAAGRGRHSRAPEFSNRLWDTPVACEFRPRSVRGEVLPWNLQDLPSGGAARAKHGVAPGGAVTEP